MLDIHSHILPGVDDGARSRRQSLQMLNAAHDAGIDVLVATPHLKRRKEDLAHISDAFLWLKPYAVTAGIRLLKGYEISYQVLLDIPIPELILYCISGTKTLLLEMDSGHLFPQWDRVLEGLVKEGYEPVIVHPERYVYIREQPEIIGKMKRFGCRIQIDAKAFLQSPWSMERRTAGKLLSKGWVDFIASDAHRPQDYWQIKTLLNRLQNRLNKDGPLQENIFSLTSSSVH